MELTHFFIIFIWGCLWGSFTNVLIIRIPLGKNWVTDRSACMNCHKKIPWWQNIPVFSYLTLKGKCSFCHSKIPFQYLAVELLCGIKALILAKMYLTDFEPKTIYTFVHHDLLLCLLIAHVFIDFKHKILPDVINGIILVLILINVAIMGNWQNAAIGFAVGFGGTLLITYLFYFLRGKVGLGGGDIKLYGLVGLALGFEGVIQNLMVSSMLGLVAALILMSLKKMQKNDHFAFGPWIIIVFIIQLHFPHFFSNLFQFR